MEKAESKNPNPQSVVRKRRQSITELKKQMGLDKIPVIRQPITIKKDGKHLYRVAGFTFPLKPDTIERLNIPPQKILFEVDREQWHKEMNEARQNESQKDKDPWDE